MISPDLPTMDAMPAARWITGNATSVVTTMPDDSVDLVLTSPPFLGLRNYTGDPDELGQEPGPGEFIDALLDFMEAVRGPLAPHGSVVVELGDSYSDSGGAGGDYYNTDGNRAGQPKPPGTAKLRRGTPGADRAAVGIPGARTKGGVYPLAKSLCLVPELFRVALAYGRNPVTGREVPPWTVRQRVIWCKPDPSVGELFDKYRPASTDLVMVSAGRDRYFDLFGVRVPATTVPGGTKPPSDWWVQRTGRYRGAHFATWPAELLATPIESMCPPRVCTTCGRPATRHVIKHSTGQNTRKSQAYVDDPRQRGAVNSSEVPDAADWEHGGWELCDHDTWRRGVVLDPFAGSGTTLMAATGRDRDAVGVDLNPANEALAADRVGPMFFHPEEIPT